mmetsp:Transcript_16154/g.21225  ORF Transcript_16154/g.21225 Transcript_16154/m.21225 type:complete len:129 (+) Transcript_16154:481-867(+)
MMKQANTRAFSVQTGEYADDAMGLTMGMLDTQEGGGNLRRTAEKRKMRQANTKASRKRAAAMQQMASAGRAASSNSAGSGLVSSMVFTPVQGLELINPDANKDKVAEANRKWFSGNAGFQSALPPKRG